MQLVVHPIRIQMRSRATAELPTTLEAHPSPCTSFPDRHPLPSLSPPPSLTCLGCHSHSAFSRSQFLPQVRLAKLVSPEDEFLRQSFSPSPYPTLNPCSSQCGPSTSSFSISESLLEMQTPCPDLLNQNLLFTMIPGDWHAHYT